jgi:hypothetical protein
VLLRHRLGGSNAVVINFDRSHAGRNTRRIHGIADDVNGGQRGTLLCDSPAEAGE